VGSAFATAVASALGEAAAEAASDGDAGAVGVAATGYRGVASTADYAAESVASPAAVVVAVGDEDGEEATVAVGALLLEALLIRREVGAEFVVYDVIVLVDAALHLGLAAAGEEGECGCGQEWGGDVRRAFHRDRGCGAVLTQSRSLTISDRSYPRDNVGSC
jgi:hypothetical protein